MHGENMRDSSLASTAAQEPASAEICKFAAALAQRAEKLASLIGAKLHPVTISACPQLGTTLRKEGREYPPLFSELQSYFFSLEDSMDIIETTMSRVEL